MTGYGDSQIGAPDEGERGEEREAGMASADKWLLECAVKDFESRMPCPLAARQVHSPNRIPYSGKFSEGLNSQITSRLPKI